MELILQASLHGYNCHALICAATGGLLLIGLRHLNRRMIEITTPRFKKQSTSRSAVYLLIESGEKERLKELLRERLIECGWKDEMKALCRAYVRKKGRNNVSVDDLVQVITPKGRASVPDSVKAELLQRIRSFLASTAI
ncbi:unnamed protein product [Citrullus colocynthis]|uniref:Transcription and mRNA export factor ENY2 n=1 Tax=Citrullus colocynthis TaxID=252529 RepID=A0ABP0XZN1_9ROSI